MSDFRTYIYEGMFLFPQAQTADIQAALDHVNEMMQRAGAEVLATQKWDERRLAFEIRKQKRGLYLLFYFKVEGSKMEQIERDCRLSDMIVRYMFLRVDHLTMEEIQAQDMPDSLKQGAPGGAAKAAEARGETLGGDEDGERDDDDRGDRRSRRIDDDEDDDEDEE